MSRKVIVRKTNGQYKIVDSKSPMQLIKTDKQYIFNCTFHEKHIPSGADFNWNRSEKIWYTHDIFRAIKLLSYADEETKKELQDEFSNYQKRYQESSAITSDFSVPCNEGLEFMPHQLAGIEYIKTGLDKGLGILVGDQMRLGKTQQAIGIINLDTSINKVLIVAPSATKINWREELKKWLTRPYNVGVVTPNNFPYECSILVINYQVLKKYKQILDKVNWDLLVVDEAHRLANAKSQQSMMVYGGTVKRKSQATIKSARLKVRHKLFLTGTPISNYPKNLWALIHYLDPKTWDSFWEYSARFCGRTKTRFGWDFSGACNLDELNQKLRSTCMIRRLRKEVWETEKKLRQIIILPSNGAESIVREEARICRENAESIKKLRRSLKNKDDSHTEEEYKAMAKELKIHELGTDVFEAKRKVALSKTPYVIDHIKEILEEERKVVVLAHHHEVVDKIYEGLKEFNPVMLTGRQNDEEKYQSIITFRDDPACRIVIGSLGAAREGVDFSASNIIVFAELDYAPVIMLQCEDRAAHPKKKEPIIIQHLVMEGSVDENMVSILIDKQKIAEKALETNHKKIA